MRFKSALTGALESSDFNKILDLIDEDNHFTEQVIEDLIGNKSAKLSKVGVRKIIYKKTKEVYEEAGKAKHLYKIRDSQIRYIPEQPVLSVNLALAAGSSRKRNTRDSLTNTKYTIEHMITRN